MLDILYQKSIEKKEEIYDFFDSITSDINLEKVEENYDHHEFNKTVQDKNFAAIDGSFNKVKYMAGYVYAVTSQTIISKHDEDAMKESESADISTISTIYNQKIDKILSTRMNILELKSTIDTLKKHPDIDYMLLDGSISGTLMNYRTPDIDERFINYLKGISYDIFRKELDEDEIQINITSQRVKGTALSNCEKIIEENNLEYNYKEIEMDLLMCLEGFEQLYCISYLLKHFKEKLVCISKTSTTKSLFNEAIPDAAVIEYTCPFSGYTKPQQYDSMRPVRYVGKQKRQVDFPVENLILSDSAYKVFFTKLNDKSNVLKIEIPYLIDNDKIKPLLEDLESISVNGYPFILKKAHDEVKIRSKYMKRMALNMGLNEKTGRDMLNTIKR